MKDTDAILTCDHAVEAEAADRVGDGLSGLAVDHDHCAGERAAVQAVTDDAQHRSRSDGRDGDGAWDLRGDRAADARTHHTERNAGAYPAPRSLGQMGLLLGRQMHDGSSRYWALVKRRSQAATLAYRGSRGGRRRRRLYLADGSGTPTWAIVTVVCGRRQHPLHASCQTLTRRRLGLSLGRATPASPSLRPVSILQTRGRLRKCCDRQTRMRY